MNWSCKLTLWQREQDGGGGQPPVKSEVRAQSNKVGRLWFFGGRCSRISGGTPEARSRLCVCRASFLMTFVTSGMSHRLPAVMIIKWDKMCKIFRIMPWNTGSTKILVYSFYRVYNMYIKIKLIKHRSFDLVLECLFLCCMFWVLKLCDWMLSKRGTPSLYQ